MKTNCLLEQAPDWYLEAKEAGVEIVHPVFRIGQLCMLSRRGSHFIELGEQIKLAKATGRNGSFVLLANPILKFRGNHLFDVNFAVLAGTSLVFFQMTLGVVNLIEDIQNIKEEERGTLNAVLDGIIKVCYPQES